MGLFLYHKYSFIFLIDIRLLQLTLLYMSIASIKVSTVIKGAVTWVINIFSASVTFAKYSWYSLFVQSELA